MTEEEPNKLGAEPASQYFPKPSAVAGKSIHEWWDSDACKKLQKEQQESLQKAVGKYYMLSAEDKYDMVQALCYIICKSEREGTSHRELMNTLGIYPEGFWIDDLMTVHNALFTEFENVTKD
jgi:hypothetical protein